MMQTTNNDWKAWLDVLNAKPVYSTHEHHREAFSQQQLDLDLLFQWSYVGWCGPTPAATYEARTAWLDKIRFNTYFQWLEKAIMRIYGIEELTADNWDDVSHAIRHAHLSDADWHLNLMKQHGGYTGFLEDCFWNTGSDVGYPDFITPVYRLDMWMMGYHPESLTNERTTIHDQFEQPPTFAQYMERFEHELRSRRPSIAGLKCASAYQRTIAFSDASREDAKAVFGKQPSEISEAERNRFGDYMLQVALSLAAELELPVQIHTGLARLGGSNPLLLEPLIAAHPSNQFVLFHGGFPWTYDTAALAHNYDNLVIDINWLPLISTTAAQDALHVYADVLRDSGKIAWGGDTWTGEEAVGASMAFRHILARVCADKVNSGAWRSKDAERFADKIMYENAYKLYQIKR
ncbi:amidohydrolase family protein [Paenibacillus lignilyticus]|uniref:Amidohydrolase family protein n=1 Tax=Paenibacillus lignilyticus TaxID=1172615 RepID=A0ABS5C793_9BACL|nr:amidohydrolase family protein [Paenibacillus lignilyticus]MBP3961862.1 amidohydrolase family protein [Paenibacillus lignilyticus]MBP3963467.1 amidohydrolase family protein [Paenibacillus lignilyticus]